MTLTQQQQVANLWGLCFQFPCEFWWPQLIWIPRFHHLRRAEGESCLAQRMDISCVQLRTLYYYCTRQHERLWCCFSVLVGRLPFKPLDCKPVIPSPVVNNSVSRKRKTSEPNSPSSKVKQPKLPDLRHSAEKLKPLKISNDNEVSSSSEAENVPATGSKSRATKNNLLEKFVRREDEISSTNDVIDLTGSGCEIECNENSPAKVQSPRKLVLKSPSLSCGASKEKPEEHFARKLVFDEVKTGDSKQKLAEINGGEEALPGSVSPKKGSSICEDVSMECEDVEFTDLCEKEEEGRAQMVKDVPMDDKTPNTSMLETSGTDADTSTSTPQKEGDSESSEETPGSKQHPVSASTPQTPGSMNTSSSSIDGAPTSGNKPKRVSCVKH